MESERTGSAFFTSISLLALAVIIGLAFCEPSPAQIDRNLNGLSDLWEIKYDAQGLRADGDADNDGCTNGEEERMGTNPWDPLSLLQVDINPVGDVGARLTWETIAGKTYRPRLNSAIGEDAWIAPELKVGGTENGTVSMVVENGSITAVEGVFARLHYDLPYDYQGDYRDEVPVGTSWVDRVSSSEFGWLYRNEERMFGWVVPPESGTYQFHHVIPEDVYTEMWIALDGIATNAVRLSSLEVDEDDYPYNVPYLYTNSPPYLLEAGVPVYLELRNDAGGQRVPGTNLMSEIQWIPPYAEDFDPEPIPSSALRLYLPEPIPVFTNAPSPDLWCAEIEVFDADSDGDMVTDWEEVVAILSPFAPLDEGEVNNDLSNIGRKYGLFNTVSVEFKNEHFFDLVSCREKDAGTLYLKISPRVSVNTPYTFFIRFEGDATDGEDYVSPPVEISMSAGYQPVYIPVPILDDSIAEADEHLAVVVPYQQNVFVQRLGEPVLIRDDDRPVFGLEVLDAAASESPVDGGMVRAFRTGDVSQPFDPLVTQTGSAVEGLDYEALPTISFAPGQSEILIPVTPIADGEAGEGSESVELRAFASATHDLMPFKNRAAVDITETAVVTTGLYLAVYGPENNAETEAWGYATLKLAADGDSALINTRFEHLTSPQTTAHIHLGAEGVPGPVVEGLEVGEVVDHVWTFGAAKDEMLEALTNGLLYANVHSVNYPAGEIRAQFYPIGGSVDFSPPPALAQDLGAPGISFQEAARFLTQCTFGPRTQDVAQVESQGITAWLDEQIAMPATDHHALIRAIEATHRAAVTNAGILDFDQRFALGWWLTSAVNAPDQLRERMIFALSQIFVISTVDADVREAHIARAKYHDMLGTHAFGNFRDLLYDVARHPLMGQYLSHIRNQKPDPENNIFPDENFAREVMQLFSIGLFELHPDGSLRLNPQTGAPIPTYGQQEISELARVFTGWGFSRKNYGDDDEIIENVSFHDSGYLSTAFHRDQKGWYTPMKLFPEYHDENPKTIIGGLELIGLDGEAELDLVIESLFQHPNTGPFISRLLIQRLVTSNPSRGYIYRVASAFADNGQGVRGDMAAVTRAIFLDHEARDMTLATRPGGGKMREPLICLTHLLRVMDYYSTSTNGLYRIGDLTPHGDIGTLPPDGLMLLTLFTEDLFATQDLSQLPMTSPTVFSFFDPDFHPSGPLAPARLKGPEFSFLSDKRIIGVFDTMTRFGVQGHSVYVPRTDRSNFDVLRPVLPVINDPAEIAERMSLTFLGGNMSPVLRDIIVTHLAGMPVQLRVKNATLLTLLSPEFLSQR